MKQAEGEIVKQFFFRGMLSGYANPNLIRSKDIIAMFPRESEPSKIFESFSLFGSRASIYQEVIEDKALRLVDMWFSRNDSDFSGGMTVIWVDDKPVWMMSYGGSYPKEAIPILKAALKDAYESKLFIGGRGSYRFSLDDYEYENIPGYRDFQYFYGREIIRKKDRPFNCKIFLGQHHYHGYLLAPIEK